MSRPQRLIEALTALQIHQHTTARGLADELGVSERTVLRDVQALIDAGIPIVTTRGPYGGIALLPGSQVDFAKLTIGEADVLRAVGLDLERARELGAEPEARTARRKLGARPPAPRGSAPRRANLPLSLADVVTIDAHAWFDNADHQVDLTRLTHDLRMGKRLRIRYRRSGEPGSSFRVVDPYGLAHRGGRWYLVADHRGAPRTYSLERLEDWEVLDEDRRLRSGTTLAGVVREQVDSLVARQKILITALLDSASLDLARRILGARVREVSAPAQDGRVTIVVGYDVLDGVHQLLQFGGHIEVIAPPQARQRMQEIAEEIAHTHLPVEPKPSNPRSVSSRASTATNSHNSTGMTNN